MYLAEIQLEARCSNIGIMKINSYKNLLSFLRAIIIYFTEIEPEARGIRLIW